jgi:hypothetical protein
MRLRPFRYEMMTTAIGEDLHFQVRAFVFAFIHFG